MLSQLLSRFLVLWGAVDSIESAESIFTSVELESLELDLGAKVDSRLESTFFPRRADLGVESTLSLLLSLLLEDLEALGVWDFALDPSCCNMSV